MFERRSHVGVWQCTYVCVCVCWAATAAGAPSSMMCVCFACAKLRLHRRHWHRDDVVYIVTFFKLIEFSLSQPTYFCDFCEFPFLSSCCWKKCLSQFTEPTRPTGEKVIEPTTGANEPLTIHQILRKHSHPIWNVIVVLIKRKCHK